MTVNIFDIMVFFNMISFFLVKLKKKRCNMKNRWLVSTREKFWKNASFHFLKNG